MKKPVIGIIPSQQNQFSEYKLKKVYGQAVQAAGGLPVLIPFSADRELSRLYLKQLDGLLLTGGLDLDPYFYGEEPEPGLGAIDPERDHFEILMAQLAYQQQVPTLGICKGLQVLNVAAGGSLIQDLSSRREKVYQHYQDAPRAYPTHQVTIDQSSNLYQIIQKEKIRVNSLHHQAIKEVAANFRVAAKAGDGIIEAIENKGPGFALGIQWHPEEMWAEERTAYQLFLALVTESKK